MTETGQGRPTVPNPSGTDPAPTTTEETDVPNSPETGPTELAFTLLVELGSSGDGVRYETARRMYCLLTGNDVVEVSKAVERAVGMERTAKANAEYNRVFGRLVELQVANSRAYTAEAQARLTGAMEIFCRLTGREPAVVRTEVYEASLARQAEPVTERTS